MRLINTSGNPVRTEEFGGLDIPPGGTVELPDGYCRAGLNFNGSRRPSAVEMLAPGLMPEDPVLRQTWGKDIYEPTPEELTEKQLVESYVKTDDLVPGAAQMVAAGVVEQRKKPGRKPKADI